MRASTKIFLVILLVGGINTGLTGLFEFDCIAWLLGGMQTMASRAAYTAVGIAALCCVPALFAPGPRSVRAHRA